MLGQYLEHFDGRPVAEDGLFRFFGRNDFGRVVGLSAHMFRDDVDAAQPEAHLKAWLDSVYT